jgi:predicted ester cyclase
MDEASELNKRKVQLFVEAVWNEGRMELIDELVAADYIGRFPRVDGAVQGPEGVRQLVLRGRRDYPDLHVKIEDQIAEDDRVATRWRATAKAPAARATAAPSGDAQCYAGISVIRLLAGKQVDSHTEYTNITRSATSKPGKDGESSAAGAIALDEGA